MYNMAMPHGRCSCRNKRVPVLRGEELERLYERRCALLSTIRELELWKRAIAAAGDSLAGERLGVLLKAL